MSEDIGHMAAPIAAQMGSRFLGGAGSDMVTTDLVVAMQALHNDCFGWALACADGHESDAEDVLQDVYVGVLDGSLRFDGRSTLRTWLYGVIRFKSIARRRRTRIRALLRIAHRARFEPRSAPSLPDEDAVAKDRQDAIRGALRQLPRRQREVLLLVFYHHLTVEESAAAMDVSLGAARSYYDRGKRQLAGLLRRVANDL